MEKPEGEDGRNYGHQVLQAFDLVMGLAILDKIDRSVSPRVWRGSLPLQYVYTTGTAAQVFFQRLKEEGLIVASRCSECHVRYLPPRQYCEKCFEYIDEWTKVPNEGRIGSFTLGFEDRTGRRLKKPLIYTLVRFKGVEGGIIHKVRGIEPHKVELGLRVTAVFRPKHRRKGSIMDILYFKPKV